MPYSVFTDPQLGRVGMTEREARASGRRLKIGKILMTRVARALEAYLARSGDYRYTLNLDRSDAAVDPRDLASRLVLGRPFPNPYTPARGALAITFDLPAEADVELAIYDLGGRLIDVPIHTRLDAGPHGIHWDGATGLAPGIYVVRLRAGSAQAMTSFVLMQ